MSRPAPAGWRARLGRPNRWQRVALIVLAFWAVLRLASFRSWADGPLSAYLAAVGFFVALAAISWLLVRVQLHPGAVLPWIVVAGVLLPGDVAHYRRLGYGPRATIDLAVSDTFTQAGPDGAPSPDRWIPDLKPGASAHVVDGALVITDPPGVTGWVDLKQPEHPDAWGYGMARPLGLYRQQFTETVDWTARLQREHDFFILLDTRVFTLEVTRFGLHALHEVAGKRQEANIETALPADGQLHRYRMERTPARLRLWLDDRVVMDVGTTPPWGFIRFGETRSDPLHGGTLTLDDVHYLRQYYAN